MPENRILSQLVADSINHELSVPFDWQADPDMTTKKLGYMSRADIDRLIIPIEEGGVSTLPWEGKILTDIELKLSPEVLMHELGPEFVTESISYATLSKRREK